MFKLCCDIQELADTPDHHAVRVLDPAVEAFALVHAAQTSKEEREKRSRRQETRESQPPQEVGGPGSPDMQGNPDDSLNQTAESLSGAAASDLPSDDQTFLALADKHRAVLNQVWELT